MRWSWYVVALGALVACGDRAVVVVVDGDLAIPAQLDGMCLSVADTDAAGGAFGRFYRLGDEIGALPQTLTVDPGEARAAVAVVRGYLHGIEAARGAAGFTFEDPGEITLRLDACGADNGGEPRLVASAGAPGNARLAASWGRGGTRVVTVAGSVLQPFSAAGDMLAAGPEIALEGEAIDVLALDADGDCDDDLLVLRDGAVPLQLMREGATFGTPTALGDRAARAAAVGDIDGDGDIDVVLGGASVVLLRNDGQGRFELDGGAIPATAATDVTALALGDVDGDGALDLAIGQGAAASEPPRLLLGDPAGSGVFAPAPGALPDIALDVRAMVAVDLDGDGFRDLLIASADDRVRALVSRGDGRLEDRSFITLPGGATAPASALSTGDWDGDCHLDLALARPGDAALHWAGTDGAFRDDSFATPAGDDVLLADIDDDGALDLLVVGGDDGLTWISR